MRHSNNKAEHDATRRQLQSTIAVVSEQGQALRALDVDKTDLQPVTGSVRFNTDGAGAIVETDRRFFQDNIGESAASGIPQNRAVGNYFGGSVPTGQLWLCWSLGFTIASNDPLWTADLRLALAEILSVTVNLRTRSNGVEIGGLMDWPDVLNTNGFPGLGNGEIGRRTFTYPIVLDPLDDFTIDLFVRKPTGAGAIVFPLTSGVGIHAYLRTTRIYDERVLALS